MKKNIALFCYTYILSIALIMIFLPGFDAFQPASCIAPVLGAVKIITLMKGLLLLFLILLFVFRRTYLTRSILLVCFAFLLGAWNYWRVLDTSSPSHITHYYDRAFWFSTKVRGTVVRDPDIRDDKTLVTIKPDLVVKQEKKIKLKGKTGTIMVSIYPSIGEYYNLVSYGDYIEVSAALLAPKERTNPYGFDYARYLKARNVYGVMYIRNPEQISYRGIGKVNPLVRFSLRLKRRLLWTIRRTMPYPESAFLGGVTLGLRGGVPRRIKEEFQATGVAHVLAVSGLHVGFVALLFMAITGIFHIRGKLRWPVVTLALVIFTIITGARPATMRAALMFSIGLFLYEWAHLGIKGSTRLTIPVAAFIILLLDPLMLPDGSFVLSFMAVWSLAYITTPVQMVMERVLKGIPFLVFIIWILFAIGIMVVSPALYNDTAFTLLFIAALPLFMRIGFLIDRHFPLDGFEFRNLPRALVLFTYAQFAIQIGMMVPLSAVYFNRFPISGVLANFIAIPLIGVIVQLGLVAGLMEVVFSSFGLAQTGLKIALLMNAGNWVFSGLFLNMSAFFYKFFPYPYVTTPGLGKLFIYYAFVCAFVWHQEIIRFFTFLYKKVQKVIHYPEISRRVVYIIFLVFLLGSGLLYRTLAGPGAPCLKALFLDVGFGNATLVQTPGGKSILIDGGRRGRWGAGKNVIAPTLSGFGIRTIDMVILTSLRPGNIGGLIYVLTHFPVKEVYLPIDPRIFTAGLTYSEFIEALRDRRIYYKRGQAEVREIYINYHELISIVEELSLIHI